MSHYNDEYFKWQRGVGEIGGILNKFKFENDVYDADVLLDFGCGGGFLLSNFKNEHKYGFEINELARKNCDSLGIKTFNAFDDIDDNFFDKIISNHAMEHVPIPLNTFKDLYAKLKPGGSVIIVIPYETPNEQQFYYTKKDINQHLHTWCPMTFGNLAVLSGFDVISCEPLQHQWCPDFKENYNQPDFHKRCMEHAKKNGNIQVKLVATKH
jgi:SAM-dependent methyltransferase